MKYVFKMKNQMTYNVPIEANTPEEATEKFLDYQKRTDFANEFRNNANLNSYTVKVYEDTPRVIKCTHIGKTMTQKFIDWHKSLIPGTEYTTSDIKRAIGCKTERSVHTMKTYSPAVRDILMHDQISWYHVGVPIGHNVTYRKGKVAA